MISTIVALSIAASAAQASDTTRASREAFTACLRGYVERSVEARMTAEDFARDYPQQCAAEQTSFRDAVIRRETSLRSTRADADETARAEIDDARINFSERFEMLIAPE